MQCADIFFVIGATDGLVPNEEKCNIPEFVSPHRLIKSILIIIRARGVCMYEFRLAKV